MALNIIFYIFAAMAVLGAFMLITSNNPVRAVISMVFTFVSAAAVWLTAQQEYLALLLIVVYVGAVLVMFMFVVMMLDIDVSIKQARMVGYWPIAIIICVGFAVLISLLVHEAFAGGVMHGGHGSVRALGEEMFQTQYLYAFELVGMLLLSAMVAAITLTLRGKKRGNKSVNPADQIKVTAQERLTMVEMPSESKKTMSEKKDD